MIYIFLLSAFLTIAIIISLFGAKSRILSPMPLHMLPWLLVMILGGQVMTILMNLRKKHSMDY